MRRETRYGVYAVLVACVGASCFFAFKLYRMYKEKDGAYRLVFKSLTVFCAYSDLLGHGDNALTLALIHQLRLR